MARKLYYKISDNGENNVTDDQWEKILALQHWYNSEFVWTAGRLAFKMYAVFPNMEYNQVNENELWQEIIKRRHKLRDQGLSENQVILQLEDEGLVIVKKGGYFDNCLASGFTRVAGNEFNAYLVCEFLLKASRIASNACITVYDEGEFIKSKHIKFERGKVIVKLSDKMRTSYYQAMISNRRVFSIVDATKYDHFPHFQTIVSDFNKLSIDEKQTILHDWNWLGYENNYDINGDDIQGFDLNKKVTVFELNNTEANS